MPQTLLALLAMMVAVLFSLQQQRRAVHMQRAMIRNELALQSTGVAEDVLGEIGALAFDEHVKGEEDEADAPSALTPGPPFNDGGTDGDDIDDFHEKANLRRQRTVQREVGGALVTDTLWFAVEVDVSYADNEGDPQANQTKFKKATVQVRSLIMDDATTVTISRLYACGGACSW